VHGLTKIIERVAALVTIAVAVFAAARSDLLGAPSGVLLVLPLLWSGAATVGLLAIGPARRPARRRTVTAGYTVILRVGAEADERVVGAAALARRHAEVLVAMTGRFALAELLREIGFKVVTAPSAEEAMSRAARVASTDALLIVSPLAVISNDACRHAAALLTDRVGWVLGPTGALDPDVIDPERDRGLWALHRSRAERAGLVMWEPDAMMIRTSLLRDAPLRRRRLWGRWLRQRAAEGWVGVEYREPLTTLTFSGPLDTFWAIRAAQQSALSADLAAGVVRASNWRQRLMFGGLLLGELRGVALLCWLLAPAAVAVAGEFPLRMAPGTYAAVVLGASLARVAANRFRYGASFRPLREIVRAAYDAPGSLMSLRSAVRRRRRRATRGVSRRLVVWTLIPFTAFTVLESFAHDTRISESVFPFSTALAVVNLALLWTVLLRGSGLRRVFRTSLRVPLRRGVVVGGRLGESVDVSLSGIAVRGAPADLSVGDVVIVTIDLSLNEQFPAIVRRREVRPDENGGDEVLVGLQVCLDEATRVPWFRLVSEGMRAVDPSVPVLQVNRTRWSDAPAVRGGISRSWVDRAALVFTAVASLMTAILVILPIVGLQPLVVRSASMEPTLQVGDVILDRPASIDSVDIGEIVTFADPLGRGDQLTHRVRSIDEVAGELHVETRGDANDESEYWSARPGDQLGVVVARIPKAGLVLSAGLGTPVVRQALLLLGTGIALAALVAMGRSRMVSTAPLLRP